MDAVLSLPVLCSLSGLCVVFVLFLFARCIGDVAAAAGPSRLAVAIPPGLRGSVVEDTSVCRESAQLFSDSFAGGAKSGAARREAADRRSW